MTSRPPLAARTGPYVLLSVLLLSSAAAGGELTFGTVAQLTTGPGGYHPRWSPDASQIAYVAGDWPEIDIYLIPAAGGERSLVPMTMGGDLALSWHPSGEHLAFDAYNPVGGGLDVYQIELATGAISRLTTVGAMGPSWSADGARLAFGANLGSSNDICSVDAGGADLRNHTANTHLEYYQCWSPDGTRLAYASERGGNTDVWILNLATGVEARFTSHPARDDRPVWSPDGAWIAFDSFRDSEHHVYLKPAAGGATIRLTDAHGEDGMADWAPDGSAICYVADGQLWILPVNGITSGQATSLGGLKALFH